MGEYIATKKLYQEANGYFNPRFLDKYNQRFIWITGARGTGKTFNVLADLIQKHIPFIYLRRTQDESDIQSNEITSSLTKVLIYCKVKYEYDNINKNIGLVKVDDKNLIYTCALSTFAKFRGFNFDDVQYIIYDEFIPEAHVRKIRAEGMALSNLYETVNRNRELEGLPAVRIIGLANSFNIANDVFVQYDLVKYAEKLIDPTMYREEVYIDDNTVLIILKHSPISKKKASTALYQVASDEYKQMAINNKFILNDFTYVQKRNLKPYRVMMQVGDLYVYKHKAERMYYVTFVKNNTKNIYTTSTADLDRLRRAERRLRSRYLDGYIYFDTYEAVALFEKYMDI